MQLRHIWRRDERHFSLLLRQVALSRESAQAVHAAVTAKVDADRAQSTIAGLEDEGWGIAFEMEELLMRQFSVPIDREDLHAFSSHLVQVLDRTTHAAHACTLVRQHSAGTRGLAERQVQSAETLEQAVDAFSKRAYGDVVVMLRDLRVLPSQLPEQPSDAEQDPRDVVIAAQIRGTFGALARASRNAADLLTRFAVKES
jgi:uncharacterized protein Yka (UPF0111/DUF47 family)